MVDIKVKTNPPSSPSRRQKILLKGGLWGRFRARRQNCSALVDPHAGTFQTLVSEKDDRLTRPIDSLSMTREGLVATSPKGTQYTSRRSAEITIGDQAPQTLFLFSPTKPPAVRQTRQRTSNSKVPNLMEKLKAVVTQGESLDLIEQVNQLKSGRRKRLPLPVDQFKRNQTGKKRRKSGKQSSGHSLRQSTTVTPDSIAATATRKRSKLPAQKKIKGRSAKEIFAQFVEEYRENLPSFVIEFFEEIVERIPTELLHLIATSMAPDDFDLKNPTNLVAAPCIANTDMVAMEGTVKFLAQRGYPIGVDVEAKCLRSKVPGLDIAHTINYSFSTPATEDHPALSVTTQYDTFMGAHRGATTVDRLHIALTCDRLLRGEDAKRPLRDISTKF